MWGSILTVLAVFSLLLGVLFLPQILFMLELWAVKRELKEESHGD